MYNKRKTILLIMIPSIIMLFIAEWFNLADIYYIKGETIFPYNTAGWFVLGSPFMLVFNILLSSLYIPVSKRIGLKRTWQTMTTISLILIILASYSSHPFTHVRSILGKDIMSKATLNKFCSHDSFNAGLFSSGVVSIDKEIINNIKTSVEFKSEVKNLSYFITDFDTNTFPEKGIVYYNDKIEIYINRGKLFFNHRSRIINNT